MDYPKITIKRDDVRQWAITTVEEASGLTEEVKTVLLKLRVLFVVTGI